MQFQTVSTFEELQAAKQGALAQEAGAALSDCPYDLSTYRNEVLRRNWQQGYYDSETKTLAI